MNSYCCTDKKKEKPKFGSKVVVAVGGGSNNYAELRNRPRINGVELLGDKTNQELLIESIPNTEIEQMFKSST